MQVEKYCNKMYEEYNSKFHLPKSLGGKNCKNLISIWCER